MLENFRLKSGSADSFSGTHLSVRCYESHPVLKIGKGKLYGGSASYPVVKDADVYVSLQNGSTCGRISDPWDKQAVVEVQYSIKDMQAPSNVARFKKMVTWLCNQLHDGKTVHVGCIGGHGRTGTVLSAIVAEALDITDAVQYVREHYCAKVVESHEQMQFLVKHYGVTAVDSSKAHLKRWVSTTASVRNVDMVLPVKTAEPLMPVTKARRVVGSAKGALKSFEPIASNRSLWKPRKK